ncbi:hypothetical protein H4W81_000035 [Nonomuraea africana]|uniref:Uncharacterized protein n=1 Tax=Nonomuraea africana TaxID=46171 RepID=A0ABR9K5H1_9ACTN|nr:hypothetical protein [Nonomuraea africana]
MREAGGGLVAHAQLGGDQLGHAAGRACQLDQPHAVGEGVVGEPFGHGEGQPGLAHSAGAGQRDQPRLGDQVAQRGHRRLPPDQAGEGRGQVGPRPGGGGDGRWRGGQRGVLFQHRLVERGQLGPRIEAQVLGQQVAQLGVARQRLALPSGQVERAQVDGAQPFAQRVLGHLLAQLVGEAPVLAQRQPYLRQLFERRQALLVESRGGGPGERLLAEVGVGGTPPQRQRPRQHRRLHRGVGGGRGAGQQLGELEGVHALGPQQVSRRLVGDQVAVAEGAAQLRHLGLQRVGGIARRVVAPQVVGEPVGGHRPSLVDQQVGQQRPDLHLGHADRRPVGGPRGDGTKHSKTHQVTVPPAHPQPTLSRPSADRARPPAQ